MLTKQDIGRWVRIRFWDHCIVKGTYRSRKKPIECEVAGMIRSVDGLKITLATWWLNGEDKGTREKNAERFEIVRSTIIKYAYTDALKWFDD